MLGVINVVNTFLGSLPQLLLSRHSLATPQVQPAAQSRQHNIRRNSGLYPQADLGADILLIPSHIIYWPYRR